MPHDASHTPAVSPAAAPGWRLRLLGRGELWGPNGPVRLERNQLVMLAYLVRGLPTTRPELAAMLWPSVPAATAGANLRQMLRRLRLACGGHELLQQLEWNGPVSLAPGLDVDLWHLRDAALGLKPAGDLLAHCGELLAGRVLDGELDATGWLDAMRVEAEGRVRRLCERELQRLQDAGELDAALGVAERWVRAEATSERAARALMGLHAALGNRSAALAVYEQLKRELCVQLEATPGPETAALAQRIRTRGAASVRPAEGAGAAAPLPAALLRPERLVGRGGEWRALEEAWAAGQAAFLAGAPGVGKSRLAVDFAASRGPCLRVGCQPGERPVAFASALRLLRQLRAERPGTRLPGWAGRILVQLARDAGGSAPTALATYEALAAAFRAATQGLQVLVVDGLEHCDDASLAFLEYLLGERPPPGAGEPVRLLACWTPGAGAAPVQALVARLGAQGQAREVRVGALSRAATLELLASLGHPGLGAAQAEALWRYAGGNPFLLLQALREQAREPEASPCAPARLQAHLQPRLAALGAELGSEGLHLLRELLESGGRSGAVAAGPVRALLAALAEEGLVGPEGLGHGALCQVVEAACAALPPRLPLLPAASDAPPRAAAPLRPARRAGKLQGARTQLAG
ncbi:AAA family ATPase [Aggregicoccus sp. 17bor-14]|uniref:AAA family ATPase n=1 Tax=Myxococcaceae TaxID=31 RepID=UPI00129CED17|nr:MULTISPECIES: AAA family ATPase [Myxococcaceae]MBF5043078.1 AAA family ATPase [Simulacricoccus sp. 17bor-14]MRI88841.1 AAA family ATPase [Aggregicoccus sp. 17bor-14]